MRGFPVVKFAETLEKVCVDVVESGKMTKGSRDPDPAQPFMGAVDAELKRRMR